MADPDAGSGLMGWAWNPHRAPLGLGNYDVNALTLALQQEGGHAEVLSCRVLMQS
jgi:hypothetical protein